MADVPKEFKKLIDDFVADMKTSFPEYGPVLNKWTSKPVEFIYDYCKQLYRLHNKQILYRDETLFHNSGINTEFLPGISFSYLWKFDDLSEKHRDMIWNYLQMILILVVDNDEIDNKIQDTIDTLKESFATHKTMEDEIPGFMTTKLAGIAKEIAEETAEDFSDLKDVKDINSVFETLFKDPEKLMSIVKNVSEKIDTKMKSGDLDEASLMDEASMLMNRMGQFPQMAEMMTKLQQQQQQQQQPSKNKKKKKATNKEEDKFFDEIYKQVNG